MNRVAIRRRDGREERIMDSVDERGDHGEGGRESAQYSTPQKRDSAATMTMMMMTPKKERKNAGRKTTDKIASSNADDGGGRGKNCTHLIYAAAFLPWEGGEGGGRGAE